MPGSTPHQKFSFYHLPTRGRAGIKLEDAWYVSNVSIIFDCSMLYYLLFWTLLGFVIHFYIIFGTNLLTGGPAQNSYFLPVLGFRRKGISNGIQRNETFGNVIFGTNVIQRTWSGRQAINEEATRQGAHPGGAPSTLVAASWFSWRRVQVSWILSDEKITFLKVLFRLDSVWYSFSSKP